MKVTLNQYFRQEEVEPLSPENLLQESKKRADVPPMYHGSPLKHYPLEFEGHQTDCNYKGERMYVLRVYTVLVFRGQTLSAVVAIMSAVVVIMLKRVQKFSQVLLCNAHGNSGPGVKPQPPLQCLQTVPTYTGVRFNLMEKLALGWRFAIVVMSSLQKVLNRYTCCSPVVWFTPLKVL